MSETTLYVYADLNMPTSWCHGCGSSHGTEVRNITQGEETHRPPEPGDISICDKCGAINVLNDILVCEKPADLEALLAGLPPDDRQALEDAVAQIKEGKA